MNNSIVFLKEAIENTFENMEQNEFCFTVRKSGQQLLTGSEIEGLIGKESGSLVGGSASEEVSSLYASCLFRAKCGDLAHISDGANVISCSQAYTYYLLSKEKTVEDYCVYFAQVGGYPVLMLSQKEKNESFLLMVFRDKKGYKKYLTYLQKRSLGPLGQSERIFS